MQDYIVPNMVCLLNFANDTSNDNLESTVRVTHEDNPLNNNQTKSWNSRYVANWICSTFLYLEVPDLSKHVHYGVWKQKQYQEVEIWLILRFVGPHEGMWMISNLALRFLWHSIQQ